MPRRGRSPWDTQYTTRVQEIEELDSDDEDGQTGRELRRRSHGYSSDRLYRTNELDGSQYRELDEEDEEEEEEEDEDSSDDTSSQDTDEIIAEKARSKIQRAKAKGCDVRLSHHELDALGITLSRRKLPTSSPTEPPSRPSRPAWTRRRSQPRFFSGMLAPAATQSSSNVSTASSSRASVRRRRQEDSPPDESYSPQILYNPRRLGGTYAGQHRVSSWPAAGGLPPGTPGNPPYPY